MVGECRGSANTATTWNKANNNLTQPEHGKSLVQVWVLNNSKNKVWYRCSFSKKKQETKKKKFGTSLVSEKNIVKTAGWMAVKYIESGYFSIVPCLFTMFFCREPNLYQTFVFLVFCVPNLWETCTKFVANLYETYSKLQNKTAKQQNQTCTKLLLPNSKTKLVPNFCCQTFVAKNTNQTCTKLLPKNREGYLPHSKTKLVPNSCQKKSRGLPPGVCGGRKAKVCMCFTPFGWKRPAPRGCASRGAKQPRKKIARATAGGLWRGAKQPRKKLARATTGGLWRGAKQSKKIARAGLWQGAKQQKKIARATAGGLRRGAKQPRKKIARATAGGPWRGATQSKKNREGYRRGSVAGSETVKKNREGYRGGSAAGSETAKKKNREGYRGGSVAGSDAIKKESRGLPRGVCGGERNNKKKKSEGVPRGVCGGEPKKNREGYRRGSVAGSATIKNKSRGLPRGVRGGERSNKKQKIGRATAGGLWRGAKKESRGLPQGVCGGERNSKKKSRGLPRGICGGERNSQEKKSRGLPRGVRGGERRNQKRIARATAGGLWRGAKQKEKIGRATAGGLWRGGAGATAGFAARKQQQCNLCCEMSLPDLPGTAVSISEESDVELHENCLQSGSGDDADINSGKAACDGKRVRRELKACISDASGFDDEEIGTLQNRAEVLRSRRNDAQLHAASLRGDSVTKNLDEAGPEVYWVFANMFFVSWWLLGIRKTEAFQWHHHLVKVAESKIDGRCPSTLKRNLHNAVWMSQYSILPLWFLVSDLDFIILA